MEKETTPSPPSVFIALLKKVKDKELRDFMEAYAAESMEFQTAFLLKFAGRLKISGKEKYELLLKQIIQSNTEPEQNNSMMAGHLDALLKEAEDQLAVKNYLNPFHLALALIKSVHPLLPHSEKPGVLHGCIIRSFSLLDNIVNIDAGPELKEAIFQTALQEAVRVEYRYSGFEDYWITLLLDAATDDERQARLLALLNQLISDTGTRQKDVINEHYEEYFLRRKMQLLEVMGRKEDAQKVVVDNLRIRTFRRELIDDYISKKDFAAAKDLILESKRSDQQKGRLYVSSEWDGLLLKIAQQEQDTRNIRQTGLRLFYDRFNIEYYRIVKATYDPEKWKAEVEKIIQALKAETHFGLNGIRALAAIFVEEKYWPRLLLLLQKNASLEFAEDYYDLLKDKFPHEMVEIYREALRRYAEHNMGREHYEYLVRTLRKIQSLPSGIEIAKTLTTEFKVKYSQRRNMVKALNKLVF